MDGRRMTVCAPFPFGGEEEKDMTKEKMPAAQAIMTFFGMQPKQALEELKELSHEERSELATPCALELGVEIVAN